MKYAHVLGITINGLVFEVYDEVSGSRVFGFYPLYNLEERRGNVET